jgi:hypothetical protein
MYNLPIDRDNESWAKINYQFLKGGFEWYNQCNPDHNRWYYLYYIGEGERVSCEFLAVRKRRHKVTPWLRNIEKFEEIHTKYEDWERKEWKKENSMSWRRTKYGQ